jgi:transglutaminase-like putative cysteine protease
MRYRIEHLTEYRYARSVVLTRQVLRLSPRSDAHQRVIRWQIRVPGTLTATTDAYGNLSHMHTLDDRHERVRIEVDGEIEVDPLVDGQLDERDSLPPAIYATATPLTLADDRLADFAHSRLKRRTAAGLLEFAQAVRAAIDYEKGTTHVQTTAAESLALGRGVCQDHAHVFIAGCRALEIPARYVSGYYYSSRHAAHAASHAWADVWVPDRGWIAIDITHACFGSGALCRLAVARDYDSACPVRGVRIGGGDEAMEVALTVRCLAEPDEGAQRARPEEVSA